GTGTLPRFVANHRLRTYQRAISKLRGYIGDMQLRFILALCVVCLFTCGVGQAADVALVGAKIYPSPEVPPIENGSIILHEGRILAVGPSATIKVPGDATVIDCKGLVVTAGFWNSH